MPRSFALKLKQTLSRNLRRRFKEAVVGFQVGALLLMPVNSYAAEGLTGGAVVEGAATIQQAGSITNIHQTSQNAVINWNTFNIGAGETANFIQPNINAGVLNNVTGGSLSSIAGQINATGSVTIVNPQGIVFHNGALINAASITASTLNVSSQDFMNGGTLNFSGSSNASIINNGQITATDGNINLFAADVQNNGNLMAPNGLINLGAGHNITLHENGTYTVTGANGSVQVLNSGIINGGAAMLTAGAGSTAVNSGVEKATVIVRQNGRVRLGTTDSVIEMAGGSMITATDGASSKVTMTGPTAEVVDASIDASGGSVLIDSTVATTVVDTDIVADDTQILSDGAATGLNVTASGDLRLDPVDVTAGGITAANIVIDTATAGQGTNLGPGLGNITVTGDLEATDPGGFIFLLANNDIVVDAVNLITNGGDVVITGDANLTGAPFNGDPSDGAGAVFLDGTSVFTEGGDVFISGIGHNDQGQDGLIATGIGVHLSAATIDTRLGAAGGTPVDLGAGGIEILGAGNTQSRMGAADVGGNIGVLITDASTLIGGGKPNVMNDVSNDIIVKGFGGGLPDADILNAADPFADFAANYGSGNAGVVIDNASTIELVYDLTNPMGNDSSPVQQAPGLDDPELHIYGLGGNGLDQNAGILIDNGSSVTANDGDLIITGVGGGVPDSLAIPMIQNDLGQGASGDPVADFQSLYAGVQNAGVAIRNGSTVRLNFELPTINGENRRRFDDVTLNHEPVDDNDEFLLDPILLITGIGGKGQNENAGVVFDTTSVELASDAHVTITGIGGGLSGAAAEALIINTDLNDGVGTTDFIDVSNQDVIDALAGALGADNAGVAIVGDGSVISMGGAEPAGLNPNVVAGDGRPVGESTGRLTINGFGGLGKDTNYGVRVEGLGAGISVESGDLYVNAYGGGTWIDSALDSNFYGVGNEGVIFSPRNTDGPDADILYPQLVQGFDTDWMGGTPDLNNGTADILLNANPNAVDFITRDADDMFVNAFLNDRVVIDNILERDLAADELKSLYTLFGDNNHGLSVEGLGAFIEGTSVANLFLDGHGGVGRGSNYGVYLSGLGAYFEAREGNNINQDLIPNVNDLYNIDDKGVFDNNRSRNGIAGLNVNGEGGGIPSIIVQGMISNASKLEFIDPDNPQYVGVGDDMTDGTIAPNPVIDNEDLITAIFDDAEGIYGGDNKGVFATGLGVRMSALSAGSTTGTADLTTDVTLPGATNPSDTTDQFNLTEVAEYLEANPAYLSTLSAAQQQQLQADLDALQTPGTYNVGPAGNIAIVGEGGFGKSDNMGVHVTGLGATIEVSNGNIDIFAYGGGVPDDVLAIDQASNGIITNIDQAIGATNTNSTTDRLHIKVDKLFERDMDGADLATLSVGPTAIYGNNNRGFLLEGLGAKTISEYAEPSFIASDTLSAPIRDNNGYFLNGRYDSQGNFIPVLPDGYQDGVVTNDLDNKTVLDHLGDNNGFLGDDFDGNDATQSGGLTALTRHPDARHVQIVGAGGTGTNDNKGVEINGLGVKVETDSADIHIEGEAGGVSTTVAQSIIENAKDTFFDVPEGTTDRTDLFYGGFENVSGSGLDTVAHVAEDDLTPGDGNPTVIGNGVHVAADTRDVIQALDALYGDSNEGVVVTGLGAKVHAKTGTPGTETLPDPATTMVEVPPGLIVNVDGTDYNPGDMISLEELANAASVTGAPATPIDTDDVGDGGPIDTAIADGAAAEAAGATAETDGAAAEATGTATETMANADGDMIANNADADAANLEAQAATSTDPNDADPNSPGSLAEQGATTEANALADGEMVLADASNPATNGTDAGNQAIADGEAAVAAGETAANDGAAAVDAAVADGETQTDDFLTAMQTFLDAVEAASEPTVTPGSDPATTAGNVFITGTGGYGESLNNGIRVEGLGAKVQADLGNIHMNGFGGGLPEGIFVIQGDGHVQGGFAGTFGPSEYETTVTAAARNYRTDRLFEVDFSVDDWDFLVAPAGPAPNGEASDGLYGDGNEGIIVTGLGAGVISDFKEPAALRAFYRAQDSLNGRTADFKFAHSYLTPGDGTAFENYNGYNDSQETGQGDAAWVGVDGNDGLVGNGIVGNQADDFMLFDSTYNDDIDAALGVTDAIVRNANGSNDGILDGTVNIIGTENFDDSSNAAIRALDNMQDGLDGSTVVAIGNSGTSLDVLVGGLSGTDATDKGELVLVDPNRLDVQAYTIARGDGELLAVDHVTQRTPSNVGSFTGAGDNFGDGTFLIGVNDNARLTTDGQGNLINTNQLVDGPGAGYQPGIAVLQKRDVELNGVGGFGRSDNLGVRIEGLGAKVTSMAATIDIEGSGGGIQSNVIRSAIENFADVTPVVLPNGVGTDRIADFSADNFAFQPGNPPYAAGANGLADLDEFAGSPNQVVDPFALTFLDVSPAQAPGGPELYNDMLEVRLTSDEIMGGTDAGGTQGLLNFYGDNNQGVLVTGLGAKVEANLTSADLWAAINGDVEDRNPLGTNGTELFNYTTGDPNYVELIESEGSAIVTNPLATTREFALDALEDETFASLTGNLNNNTITELVDPNAIIPTSPGDGANFTDPARGVYDADANIIGSVVDHQFANDADVVTATLTPADLTNESAAVTRAAIAEASDNIIVTARESRANVSIVGHGGVGKSDNWGVHLLGLGVKAVATTGLTGKDAGNIVIDGVGGGIPAGLNGVYGVGDNVVAIDHRYPLNVGFGGENFITDKLLEADFSGDALKDPVYGIPALFGDNNMGFELNGLGAKVVSDFEEPFVAIGPINPELNSLGTTIETALTINENRPDPLRTYIHREDDHTVANTNGNRAQVGLPIVASRDVMVIGDGGTGTDNNKGVFVTGLGAKIESFSADIDVLGNTRQISGIPNAVIQSMIENASDVVWDIPDNTTGGIEDNDRIADRNPVTNLDLMEAIAMTYGVDNRGVHVTGLGAKIESKDTDVSSAFSNFDNPMAIDVSRIHYGVDDYAYSSTPLANDVTRHDNWNDWTDATSQWGTPVSGEDQWSNNKGTGNIQIVGNGGYGQDNNIGFEIAGLGVKVQSGVGNIDIIGQGGGVPAAVLAMDNNSVDGGARNYLVDKLFERDFSSTDLDAFYAGPTAIYGSNNAGIIVTGLGAKVQSDYIEPIAGSGAAPSDQSLVNSIWRERHVRNINGNILTGDYTGGDTWTASLAAAPDITDPLANVASEHPLSRRVSLIGDGGWGIDNNRGVEVSGLGAKVQSESADISLLGNTLRPINTYAIPDSVVVSIIENANDTTPLRDGNGNLLTDRTDGVFPGFVVGVDGVTDRDIIFDTTGAGFISQTVITDDTNSVNGFASTDTTAIDHQGNSLRYSGGTFDGEGIHVAARNDALISLLDAIYGDNNRGVYVTGLGTKVHSVNASFGGNVTVVGNGGRGEANNVGYELNGLGVKTVAEHGNVWITGNGGGVPSTVLAIDHAGNGRADKLFEVDMDAADLALFAANIYDDNNRGVYVTGLGAKVESNFKEPAALRRFVDPESGEVKYAFAYNDPFEVPTDLHGEPINFSDYGSPNDAFELHSGDWTIEDQMSPTDLGYVGLDVRPGALSGTDATNRGELVLVDPGNEDSIGAFLITDAYGELQDVNGLTNANNFMVNGDNFSSTGALVGVNDNARVTTDAAGNIVNVNLLVDGPGAGYQQGVAVVQTRDVVINGTGGYGKNNNMGFELNGLGAKVATTAADIDIHGVAGGIPSDVVRSIIENGADITPIAGTDRVADFSVDNETLDVTAFDGLNNDGGNTADMTQPTEFNNGIMIALGNFVADLDEFIPVADTNHVQGYIPGHDGVVDNPILTNPAATGPANGNVVNGNADIHLDDLRRQRVESADLISTLDTLYGDNNKGVFATGLGVKIETNLTAETLAWRSSDLGEAANPLGTLGTELFNYTTGDPNGLQNLDGNRRIINDDDAAHDAISTTREFALNALEDETFASLHGNLNNTSNVNGVRDDGNGNLTVALTPDDLTNESAAVTRAAIAEAADTIVVTARRSRADVTIIGEGGTGKNNNYGVQVTGLGATVAAKTSLVGQDAGNILIDGVGGGIPSDVNNNSDFNGNVIAIDHPENGLTDKLLESDFLGADFTALAALFGDNNMGFELNGLGAKVQSDFAEPYVAIAPINPSVSPNAGTLAGALNVDEHQPDPLRSYVYLEENAGANGIQYGLPITGSRDVQIIGDGGTGTSNNKGVFVTGLGAKIQSESADIWVLGNTRRTAGIPDAVVNSMIENASDVVWNIPGSNNEDNDRIMDNQPVSNADLIAGITAIYGDDNRGVHVTGLGTKIVSLDTDVSTFSSNYDDPAKLDVSEAYTNVFGTNQNFGNRNGTGNITIEGNGGRGKGTNVGVEQTGLGTTIQSGVGNIKILAQGGGIPNEVLVIDGTEGAPLASRNYLVDKLFERDMNDADLALIPGIFGSGNEGFVLSGLGAKVQSDYIETPAGSGSAGGGESSLVNSPWEENYIRDLDGNFLTGAYTLGHNDSAEMFTETGSNAGDFAVAGESPLARRVTIIGNGGTGIDDNKGVRVQGLGAKIQSESADITLHGNETTYGNVDGNYLIAGQGEAVVGSGNIGGMQDAVIRSLIENAKSPFTAGTDRTDGVVGDFIAQTVVNPAGDPLEGQPFQIEDLTPTDEFRANAPASTAIDTEVGMNPDARRYSDGLLNGEGVFVAATNIAVMGAMEDLYGDGNIGIQVEGLGAKVHSVNPLFGGDIDMVGNGGRGQSENFGIKVQGLGANITAEHGSIDMDGVAGGPPSEVFAINNNGRIDRLFEVDFDIADLQEATGNVFAGSADNTGVRVQGLGAKVESNFKEPPALRAFVDPVTGYTKYAFAYSDPFEVPADFHGEPADFDDYDSPNGSDQVNGGFGMPNGQTDDTDKGTLVLTNGNTSDGRLLVPNTFGELEVGGQSFVLNDNAAIGGDTPVDGVPVIQMRTVDINGQGGNGQSTNHGVQVEGLGAKVASLAADINIYGDAGGIPSDVINSIIENVADVTAAAGRDRIADFSQDNLTTPTADQFGTITLLGGSDFLADIDQFQDGVRDGLPTGPTTVNNIVFLANPGLADDLLETPGATSDDIIAGLDALYGSENKGVLIKGLGAKVQATLTPEQLPQHSADVAANLGTTGEEEIFFVTGMGAGGPEALDDLPTFTPGTLSGQSDDQRAQTNRDIAEAADTILLTAQISRADVKIEGRGGTGKGDNIGVHIMGLGAKVIADHATAGDAGNIDIDGLGGGIPMDVLQIGSNGLTDTLLETDLTPAVAGGAALNTLLLSNNHGVAIEGLGAGVESTFLEPFVASAVTSVANSAVVNDDLHGAVYTDGVGNPLVAFRTVTIDGEANATIDGVDHVGSGENKGVFVTGLGSHVESVSSNILINGQGGGVADQLLHDLIINMNDDPIAGTDRINDGTREANNDILLAILTLYGDQNKGIEFSGLGTRVESTDDRVSAPNSLVGNVSLVGHAGPGASDNIGVEVNGLGALVASGVGNILVEGFGGGPSAPVVANSVGVIDSINELQGLTPTELLGVATNSNADRNYGVYVAGLGAKVESKFDEPDVGDIEGKAYSYRTNDVRNPFFINNMDLAKTDTTGFVRVLKTDLDGGPLGLQGNGILRDDLVAGIGKAGEGREVVIAGMGGTGQNQNKGVFFEGLGVQATSIDADIDIDGLAGGASDSVIAILNADHPDAMAGGMFDTAIANFYGTENHGVEFAGLGAGAVISDEGTLEVNGTGGEGYAQNKGILITGQNAWSVTQGDIVMVGKGGGILETFNAEYDAAGNPGDRVENHGIEVSGMSTVASMYETDEHDDLYETEAEEAAKALLLLDGMVGNNMELGNDQVGEVRDITSADYVNDLGLGGPADATTAQGDVGIIVEGMSTVSSIDADIDLYANLDLLVQGLSTVESVGNGDLAAVATRHLEVSGASKIGTSGTDSFEGGPTQTTIAWDQALPAFARDGRLKIDAASQIDAGAGAGELRLYGNRRGPEVFDFGVNMEVAHPTGFSSDAFGNEIDPGATFNGVAWTGIYNVPPEVTDHAGAPAIDTMNESPAVNSGDHNLEFCPWEQEQWGVAFDVANRRAVADSDRFGTTQAPSAYNFGNPGVYTGDVTFFYPGISLHETFNAPADCMLLPFSCNMRERLGPMTYSEMLQSVFGDNGSIGYGEGWEGATGGTLGDGFSAFGSTPFNVTSPADGPIRFDNLQSLIEYFEEAPAGSYGICGNGADGAAVVGEEGSGSCTTYEHDPEADDWQDKLMDALEAETPPVPPVPPTAELDLEINISGL